MMIVNEERVPDALVEHEFSLLQKACQAQATAGELSRNDLEQLRLATACAVVDRILLRQAAERDDRPIDPGLVDAQIEQ